MKEAGDPLMLSDDCFQSVDVFGREALKKVADILLKLAKTNHKMRIWIGGGGRHPLDLFQRSPICGSLTLTLAILHVIRLRHTPF